MEDRNAIVPLSDADEAVCAYFIENPIAMRRVVQMMPHGYPPLDFLQKLWSYAAMRNRKVDLANALLSAGVEMEVHIFRRGPHGLATAEFPVVREESDDVAPFRKWVELSVTWIRDLCN